MALHWVEGDMCIGQVQCVHVLHKVHEARDIYSNTIWFVLLLAHLSLATKALYWYIVQYTYIIRVRVCGLAGSIDLHCIARTPRSMAMRLVIAAFDDCRIRSGFLGGRIAYANVGRIYYIILVYNINIDAGCMLFSLRMTAIKWSSSIYLL